jgi:hypothetical protein
MWRSSAAQQCQGLKQVTSPTGPHPINTPPCSTTTPSRTTAEPAQRPGTPTTPFTLHQPCFFTAQATQVMRPPTVTSAILHCTSSQPCGATFPNTEAYFLAQCPLFLWPAASPNIHPQRPLLSPLFPILTRRFNSISTIALPFSVVLLLLARVLSS